MTLLKPYRILWILAAFYILAYLIPLDFRPMLRPDEFRYAEVPREMLASGDWVTPKMLGIRYFEKPALGYQLTAQSFSLFGENAFALRLPSALAALLSALLIFLLARIVCRDRVFPFLSAGIFLTFGLVFGVGTFGVLDMQLTAALTGALVFGFLAWRSRAHLVRELACLIAAGLFAGAAFLIKGGLAFVVPAIVLVPFLMLRGEWKRIFLYGITAFAVAALVALPWSLAIHRAEPDFWRYFLIEEHWKRFTGSTYDRDPEPFWYFIPVLLGGMLPAGLLWLTGWLGWKPLFQSGEPCTKRERLLRCFRGLLLSSPFLSFLVCWFAIPFLFYSASSCKLGTYILPCFPPLAMLTAYGVCRAFRINRISAVKWLNRMLFWFGCLTGLLAVSALLYLLFSNGLKLVPAIYEFPVWPALTVLLLGAWAALLIFSVRRKGSLAKMCLFLFGMAPALLFGLHSLPVSLLGPRATEAAIRECLKEIPVHSSDCVLVDRNTATAAAWVLKRPDLIVIGKPGELQYGFNHYPEYASRWYQENELDNLIHSTPPGKRVWIMMRKLERKPLPPSVPSKTVYTRNGISIIRF